SIGGALDRSQIDGRAPAPQPPVGLVESDPREPRSESRIPAESTERCKGADISLLDDVFRLAVVAYQTAGDAKEASVVPPDQGADCRLVPLARERDQSFVAQVVEATKTSKRRKQSFHSLAAFDDSFGHDFLYGRKRPQCGFRYTGIRLRRSAPVARLRCADHDASHHAGLLMR